MVRYNLDWSSKHNTVRETGQSWGRNIFLRVFSQWGRPINKLHWSTNQVHSQGTSFIWCFLASLSDKETSLLCCWFFKGGFFLELVGELQSLRDCQGVVGQESIRLAGSAQPGWSCGCKHFYKLSYRTVCP